MNIQVIFGSTEFSICNRGLILGCRDPFIIEKIGSVCRISGTVLSSVWVDFYS